MTSCRMQEVGCKSHPEACKTHPTLGRESSEGSVVCRNENSVGGIPDCPGEGDPQRTGWGA